MSCIIFGVNCCCLLLLLFLLDGMSIVLANNADLIQTTSLTCTSRYIVSSAISDGWLLSAMTLNASLNAAAAAAALNIPVSLPGHVALQAFLGDPYQDFEEIMRAPAANQTWMYSISLPPAKRCPLSQVRFESIDTVAKVSTQSSSTLTQNYFIPVTHSLSPADSQLTVTISPALQYASQVPSKYPLPHTVNFNVWDEPSQRNRIRKPGSDFGWDWGPAFPQAGIPRPVSLEQGAPGAILIETVVVHQQHWTNLVCLQIKAISRRLPTSSPPLTFRAQVLLLGQDKQAVAASDPLQFASNSFQVNLTVSHPLLWYPIGYGDQPLYTLQVWLDDNHLAFTKRIGLRSVRLVQWQKMNQPAFHFIINHRRVQLLGSNYVPADAFEARESRDNTLRVLKSVVAANHNTLRVWGGGRLPPDYFYDLCDELGVLVWQDLPFACAIYPTTGLDMIREETRGIVSRLQHHASLIAWGGNNEVEASFPWFPQVTANLEFYKKEYIKLFVHTIQPVVAELDPYRPYLDSSPSNGAISPLLPKTKVWGDVADPTRGDVHFYDYSMQCEDIDAYPRALFVSEHGVQSLPGILLKYLSNSSPLFLQSVLDARLHHENGFEQMNRNARRLFPMIPNVAKNYSHRALISHYVQGQCLDAAVWSWRNNRLTSGVLLWSLNDEWPGVSWSLLEYDASWKASMYFVKRAFAKVVTRVDLVHEEFVISCQSWLGALVPWEVTVERFSWDGSETWTSESFRPATCNGVAKRLPSRGATACRVTARWGTRFSSNSWFVGPWLARSLGHPTVKYTVSGSTLTLASTKPQAYVWVHGMEDKGYFEPDNGFHMLGNESRTLTFVPFNEKAAKLDSAQVRITSLSDLVHWNVAW